MTPELRLMLSPAPTYARLARQPSPVGPIAALRRPLLAAVVLGTSVAIAATGHVAPALVVSTTLSWLFVIVFQVAIAVAVIAGPSRRTVGIARALDLFFASHTPWSLWLLAAAAVPPPLGRWAEPLLVTGVVPLILTWRMLAAFFREVLQLEPRRAFVRLIAQQGVSWMLLAIFYAWAVAIVPRIFQWLGW